MLALTYYELICPPRQINDINQIPIGLKKIDRIVKEIMRCNICLEIFNDPVNIKSCLHKFCKRCIEDYNRRIKKECALCRHSVETRRLMREDTRMREIINCLIPNIDMFKDLEEKFYTNYLPSFYFKDGAHKQQQLENAKKIENEDLCEAIAPSNPSNIGTESVNLNFYSTNNNQDQREILQRKQHRSNINNNGSTKRESEKIIPSRNVSSASKKKQTLVKEEDRSSGNGSVGVKLICDSENYDLKKYFSKTKLYTNENISLDYFSKYICFKNDYNCELMDKIKFHFLDANNNKCFLEKSVNLREIRRSYNVHDGELIKLHFTINP